MKITFRNVRRCTLIVLGFACALCFLPLLILADLLMACILSFLVWTGHVEGAQTTTLKDLGKYFTQAIPMSVRGLYVNFRNAFKEACQ